MGSTTLIVVYSVSGASRTRLSVNEPAVFNAKHAAAAAAAAAATAEELAIIRSPGECLGTECCRDRTTK